MYPQSRHIETNISWCVKTNILTLSRFSWQSRQAFFCLVHDFNKSRLLNQDLTASWLSGQIKIFQDFSTFIEIWKCQDFLYCRYLIFENVKIESLSKTTLRQIETPNPTENTFAMSCEQKKEDEAFSISFFLHKEKHSKI